MSILKPELRLTPMSAPEHTPFKNIFSPVSATVAHDHQAEHQLKLYAQALSEAHKVVYRWNLTDRKIAWSDNLKTIMPFALDERMHSESHWMTLIHPDDVARFRHIKESLQGRSPQIEVSYRLTPGDGHTYQVKQSGQAHPLPDEGLVVTGMMEVERIAEVSVTPELADLSGVSIEYDYPPAFLGKLKAVIAHSKENNASAALFIVNINNLAMIINAYGHQASETAMAHLTYEMRKDLGAEDAVDRIARDQIGVIISRCTREQIAKHATRMQDIVQNYGVHSKLGALHVTCTIGSVDIPESAHTATDAIDRAFIALSSTQGIVYRSFEDSKEDGMVYRQQMGLANYLRKSIHENRLRLAYQPIVESKTGEVAHFEALLRLIGDDGKISSAGALIPVAERMGLINMIDHIVFDMVAKELKESSNVVLAFNVSNLTTDDTQWLDHATMYLKDNPEIAPRMIVEITETAAQRDLRRTAYFVASLQALGCQVALDDFGSGYTSFRQLKALSVDMVKIDGTFIKDLVDSPDNRFFVKTLLDFTNGFGLTSVAEFVEKGETAKMLMELGVGMMQGYYFGKPENYRRWLNKGEYNKS